MPAVTSSPATATCEKTGPAGLEPQQLDSLAEAFAEVPDPRSPRGRWHPLAAILLITACAVTCDADGFTAVWQWVQDAPAPVLSRLRVRLDPLTGVGRAPSESTIRRTIARVDAQAVERAAGGFVAAQLRAVGVDSAAGQSREREARRARQAGGHDKRPPRQRRRIAFDGKVMRGARRPDGTRVTLLAGACHDSGIVVNQREITAKSNEIPELREQVTTMDLTGVLATADAAHCQRDTAEQIITAGGDYLLILKANQGNLLHAAAQVLAGTDTEWASRSHHSSGRGHGRTEQRTVRVADATGIDFPHAAQVFRTVRYRGGLDGQRATKQVVYGITSLTADQAGPADIAVDQRGHWGIENRTHHVRDTTFDEDNSQVRTGNAPAVMATMRNLAIDTFRASGYVNIAHARRHHTHDYNRVLDLYNL